MYKSTKRPISNKQMPSTSKRQRKEAQDILLEKAIGVMEMASNKSSSAQKEIDDIFGEYVASEIKAIRDPQVKRRVKFHIQSILFSAQGTTGSCQTQPIQPCHPVANWEYPEYMQFNRMHPRDWSTPLRSPTPTFSESSSSQGGMS